MSRSLQNSQAHRPNFYLSKNTKPPENKHQVVLKNNKTENYKSTSEEKRVISHMTADNLNEIDEKLAETKYIPGKKNVSIPLKKLNTINSSQPSNPTKDGFAALGRIRKVHQQNKENYQRSRSLETISKQPKTEPENKQGLDEEASTVLAESNLMTGQSQLKSHYVRNSRDSNHMWSQNMKKMKSQNELSLTAENVSQTNSVFRKNLALLNNGQQRKKCSYQLYFQIRINSMFNQNFLREKLSMKHKAFIPFVLLNRNMFFFNFMNKRGIVFHQFLYSITSAKNRLLNFPFCTRFLFSLENSIQEFFQLSTYSNNLALPITVEISKSLKSPAVLHVTSIVFVSKVCETFKKNMLTRLIQDISICV